MGQFAILSKEHSVDILGKTQALLQETPIIRNSTHHHESLKNLTTGKAKFMILAI